MRTLGTEIIRWSPWVYMWGERECSHQDPAGFLGVQPQVASKHTYFEAAQGAISISAPEHREISELMWYQRTKAIQEVRARARDTEAVPVKGDVVASTGCPTGSHAGWHTCAGHVTGHSTWPATGLSADQVPS